MDFVPMVYGIVLLMILTLLFLVSRNQVRISYSDLTPPLRLTVCCEFFFSLLGINWLMEAGERRVSLQVFQGHFKIHRKGRSPTNVLPTGLERSKKKKKSKFTWAAFWRWVQVLKVPLPQLIRRLLSCSQNPRLEGRIEFGFSNPAETGMLLGALLVVRQVLVCSQQINLEFYPNFQQVTCKSKIDFSADFRFYQILMAMGRFLIHTGWRYYKVR